MRSPRARSALRPLAPLRLREELYKVRRLGLAKYARYTRLERVQHRKPRPQANAPFDIGAPAPIVLHETTVRGIETHWVTSGQGIRELQAFKRVAPGHSTFLDIGAGSGIFSAAFCALTGNPAWAFEPSPVKYEELIALIELNPNFAMTPFNTALGHSEGEQAVRSDPGALFRAVDGAAAATATVTMPVQTLDGFVTQHDILPDFAKIDVDGMELEVLRGGAETFRRSIDTLMLEVHCSMLMRGETPADVQAALAELGFDLFTLDFRPIPDFARYVEAEPEMIPGIVNIVCRKRRSAR